MYQWKDEKIVGLDWSRVILTKLTAHTSIPSPIKKEPQLVLALIKKYVMTVPTH